MTKTLTALFDTRAAADAAKAKLLALRIDAAHIHIVDQSTAGATGTGAQHEGFWSSLKNMFVSDEDRHAYGEGIRRGGFLLTTEVEEAHADEAVDVLEGAGSVDFDARQADWKKDGWTDATAARGGTEEVIPVIDEKLVVGKREVERGGARVRSYIRDVPVNEDVSLREEHVSVERRPVDRALNAGEVSGDLLRDRTIEMTETAEEAVIGKEARVVEEVVVRKTADTRVEHVSDTVRHTEVEVDDDPVRKFAGVGGTGATGPGATQTTYEADAVRGGGGVIDHERRVDADVGETKTDPVKSY